MKVIIIGKFILTIAYIFYHYVKWWPPLISDRANKSIVSVQVGMHYLKRCMYISESADGEKPDKYVKIYHIITERSILPAATFLYFH